MNTKVYDISGNEKGTVELAESVFNITPSKSAIYYALRAELSNKRQGTASTKTRSDVVGTTRKPFRQKGTGRARAGSYKSPVRVGGGVAFGPHRRSFRVNLPRKMKWLSICSVLSLKCRDEQLKVVEDFSVESGKTREFASIAMKLVDEERRRRVLFVDGERDQLTRRAGRNIPWLTYFDASLLSTRDLFYATQLVLTESAVKQLNEKYAGGGSQS